MIKNALDQYTEICTEAVKNSGAKVAKRIEKLLIEVLTLYMIIPRKINFTQFERFGTHDEQTYRNNFERKRSENVNWLKLNAALAERFFDKAGRVVIAIDPSYIFKSGFKTPHIGWFWSGCAQAVKRGLEIMGIGLVNVEANDCIMLRAHQSLNQKELNLRNKSQVEYYISVIKRYSKELLKLSNIVVADAFFSTKTFTDGIKALGFNLVSRLRDNSCLFYLYDGEQKKRGRKRIKGDQIDFKNLCYSKMTKLKMEDLEGKAYTLLAYSRALKSKIRLVIWIMPNGKHKLFFSNDLSLSGEEVVKCYRSRFQIEFCFRDAKQFAGLSDCQARSSRKLDYAFNASFASLNAAKVMMKEIGMEYSMASFKSLMFNTYITQRIFKTSGYRPNQTLICKIFKDLFGLQRRAA